MFKALGRLCTHSGFDETDKCAIMPISSAARRAFERGLRESRAKLHATFTLSSGRSFFSPPLSLVLFHSLVLFVAFLSFNFFFFLTFAFVVVLFCLFFIYF